MTLAYILCSFGGFTGILVVVLGLIFGIRAMWKLDEPVNRIWSLISSNFLLAGGITAVIFLFISLFLREPILY
jgi:hypothetical protein